jgi:hypothetical protein
MNLELEQIQDLPWATLDDLLDAQEDVAAYGKCWAEIVSIDGDLRMKRVEYARARLSGTRVHIPDRGADE